QRRRPYRGVRQVGQASGRHPCRALAENETRAAPRGDSVNFAEQRAGPKAEADLIPQDRLRRVANRLDVIVNVKETHDPARATFEAFITPGKSADHAALAEHHLDIAAEVFRMQQPFLERPVMEWKHVG